LLIISLVLLIGKNKKMKEGFLKRGAYMTIMIIFLILSLFTNDVFISNIYAAISIVLGLFACNSPKQETNIEYE
jgi:hypothetical protein